MATSTPKRYSQVLQTFGRQYTQDSKHSNEEQTFSRETEVVPKFPLKRTRQYIYLRDRFIDESELSFQIHRVLRREKRRHG